MAPLLLFLSFSLLIPFSIFAKPGATEFLYPNFTTSNLNTVENSGIFLLSRNSTFALAFYNPDSESSRFYLSILHHASHTPVWTANPSSPLQSSLLFSFTSSGLSLTIPNSNSSTTWSTPSLSGLPVALKLLDSGELRLLDSTNKALWSSFSHPTDTLLPGQRLSTETSLFSATNNVDLTPGPYRLVLTSNDLLLQWNVSNNSFLSYWSLSSDLRSTQNSNQPVSYMNLNRTGLYLFSNDRRNTVVSNLQFAPLTNDKDKKLWFLRLDSSGRLLITSFDNLDNINNLQSSIFSAPTSDCDLPFTCNTLGLCSVGSNGSTCACPTKFGAPISGTGCVPVDGSVLPSSENNTTCLGGGGDGTHESSSQISYLNLGIGITYFANKFVFPHISGIDFNACEIQCTGNCSCLGFFYKNSSDSCFLLDNKIGSFSSSNTDDSSSSSIVGYIKTINPPQNQSKTKHNSSFNVSRIFLSVFLCALVIIPTILLYILCMKWKHGKIMKKDIKQDRSGIGIDNDLYNLRGNTGTAHPNSSSKEDIEKEEIVSIPGLPTRFTFSDLETATFNFSTLIGSGGFGSVYKGHLPDKTVVAVKRMSSMGMQGKREFLTEIAVIGNIRHINLVKLRGFCTERQNRLLVYEYMNRGSLDQSLFGLGPPIKWSDRVQISIGAARGLAYLHSSCDHKILHCDIKPENILLDDKNGVKIADFGLAKLLTPEQSGLFTTLRGTRGYLAPEWLTNSGITDKTDVYSFGMVLLEIVHGRKNWSKETWSKSVNNDVKTEQEYFPMVALQKHEEKLYEELVDCRIEETVVKEEIERVVKVALCCLHEDQVMRPSMGFVSAMLEGSMNVCEPKVEYLNYLRVYGRGFMMKNPWGSNEIDQCDFESSSTSGAWYVPSYMSAQQLSEPR